MFIDVSDIRKSVGQAFHFDLTEDIWSLIMDNSEIRFLKPLHISLDVESNDKVLIFSGNIRGDLELVCNRCLEWYPYHLNTDFAEEFCHVSNVAEVIDENRNNDDIHIFEGNRIKLDDIILESVLLAIPMKSICHENCRGLCSICGTNLNKHNCACKPETLDPRLGVLKKYFEP